MEKGMESARKMTRRSSRMANRTDRLESLILVMMSSTRSSTARISQGSVSSDVVKSLVYVTSSSSTTLRARKRNLTSTTPDVPVELVLEMRTSSTADIGAELIRRAEKLIKVVTTSTNMKEHLRQNPEAPLPLVRWS